MNHAKHRPRLYLVQIQSQGRATDEDGSGRGSRGVVKPSPHPLISDGRNPKVTSEASEEAQALLVLRCWQEMPGLGIQLIPEHVETRPLYHPRSPGLLQVKGLQHP